MSETQPIPILGQIKCLMRELELRKRVYPRWVAQGKMKKADADHEISAMQAALATLLEVDAERKGGKS